MVFSFFSHGGAIPFSSFLSTGNSKKRTNKRSTKRTNKRSNNKRRNNKRTNNKRSTKRTNQRTKRRTNQRTNKRTKKRTTKRTMKRTNKRKTKRTNKRTNKKSRIQSLKTKCKCPKSMNKDSPDGLGLCAKCSPEGIVMKGKDGNLWESKGDHWEMIRKDMSGGRLS